MAGIITAPIRTFKNGWNTFSDKVCNALTEQTRKFLQKYTGADLIFVTGPTGVGKSSFIASVSGVELDVSSKLESGTRQTALVPAVIRDKRYLFLDMPGFDAEDIDDWNIFVMIMTAMATVQPFVKFRGLLYVDTFDNIRATTSAKRILTWVKFFCGNEFMPDVTIVTTKWDKYDEGGIEDKLKTYDTWKSGVLLKPLISNGAITYHHGLIYVDGHPQKLSLKKKSKERSNEAKSMIHDRYGVSSNNNLQAYNEIAQGRTIETTSAGHWLQSEDAIKQSASINSHDYCVLEHEHIIPNNTRGTETPQNDPTPSPQPKSQPADPVSVNGVIDHAKFWISLLYNAACFFYKATNNPTGISAEFLDSNIEEEDLWQNESAFNVPNSHAQDETATSWCIVM